MALGNPPSPPPKETFRKKEISLSPDWDSTSRLRGSVLRPLVPPGEKNSLLEKRATHPPLFSPELARDDCQRPAEKNATLHVRPHPRPSPAPLSPSARSPSSLHIPASRVPGAAQLSQSAFEIIRLNCKLGLQLIS